MIVAVDISPLSSGHSVRGIGTYTHNLTEVFSSRNWGIHFKFFKGSTNPIDADIIHYPYFDLFFHTLYIRKLQKRVVTIHDVIPLISPKHFPVGLKGRFNFILQKIALKNVDAVICDSQTSKQDIAVKLAVPLDKIHVIFLAPGRQFKIINDKKSLLKIQKKYHLPEQFILYVGDVNWHKNIPNLLQAVKIAKVNLVMVGQALVDNSLPQTRQINQLISKLGLTSQVIKTGYVPDKDLTAIYNLATATVSPSFYEGFGLPVLESMACGTPVICSNIASIAEIAGPALICDPTNPANIAAKINSILAFPEVVRKKYSQKLIDHASHYTWSKVATETIKVYKKLFDE